MKPSKSRRQFLRRVRSTTARTVYIVSVLALYKPLSKILPKDTSPNYYQGHFYSYLRGHFILITEDSFLVISEGHFHVITEGPLMLSPLNACYINTLFSRTGASLLKQQLKYQNPVL